MKVMKKIQRAPLFLVYSFLLNGIISAVNYLYGSDDMFYILPMVTSLLFSFVIAMVTLARFYNSLDDRRKAIRGARKLLSSTKEMLILFWCLSIVGNLIIYSGMVGHKETLILIVGSTLAVCIIYTFSNSFLLGGNLFDGENKYCDDSFSQDSSNHEVISVNPATGAPMIGSIDSLGNPYGMDDD